MTIALNTLSRDSAHVPYTKPTPANASSYQPTHPGLLKVVLQQGKGSDGEDTYSSYLIAEQVSLRLLLARQVLILLVLGLPRQHCHHPSDQSDTGYQSLLKRTARQWRARSFRAEQRPVVR